MPTENRPDASRTEDSNFLCSMTNAKSIERRKLDVGHYPRYSFSRSVSNRTATMRHARFFAAVSPVPGVR